MELCEECGQDLLDVGVPTPGRGIQAKILSAPLSALNPASSIELDRRAPVAEALRRMRDERHGSVLVMDHGKIAGIFTERDVLLKIVCRGVDAASTPVADVMTAAPETLKEDDPLAFAIHLMAVRGFRHIPVTREGAPPGIVSIRGVIGYLTRRTL
jgi:CBS domain-containing protein